LAAVNEGSNHIIIGLGGSASNDGGAGLLQVLGFLELILHSFQM
jgi:glycerate kinase